MNKLLLLPIAVLVLVAAAAGAGAGASPAAAAVPPLAFPLAPLSAGALVVSTHDPFGSEECGACHTSADKSAPGPVKDTTSALCLECHDDPAPGATHRHGGASGTCIACHNPHNATVEKLLHAPVRALCARCHTTVAPGTATTTHAPIRTDASCATCHLPHGATQPALLSAPLAATFYAPYSRDAYALCFSCHKPALVEEPTTTTATRFRDGDKNLHTIHVMRADGKGRTCRACHDAHATQNPALVAKDVAFGSHGWRLPLGFRAADGDTGGSCAKTCHVSRSYRR